MTSSAVSQACGETRSPLPLSAPDNQDDEYLWRDSQPTPSPLPTIKMTSSAVSQACGETRSPLPLSAPDNQDDE
ncbi:hypothetical protein BLNAU_1242 [Blattamonas nauphoetae]|uniref:Uncharacterized protein n=1 Tax=Blattamonas nauphoetae TaxID=2049346 RepID=A0ABQ9YIT9_9EUKA|nr:hypothetical protein BLNAU_1242 [Blattamonas nauphoetae]